MSKNLIIFGAGASTGSQNYNSPPVGNNLFDELVKISPNGWGKINKRLSKIFQNDFESGMNEIERESHQILIKIQKSMAAYFVTFRPTDLNLYLKMVRRINKTRWNGSIVTLNYDRLLQISLEVLNLKQKFDSSTFPEIEVCYPHGCCNFFCGGITASKGISINQNSILFGDNGVLNFDNGGSINFTPHGITTSGNFIDIVNDPKVFYEKLKEGLPPVMSYFIHSKFTTSCTNFLVGERKRFDDLVMKAENIAIVGMKLRKHDNHIWDPLSLTPSKIIYCGGSDRKDYQQWARKNRANYDKDLILHGYWNENFDKICHSVGL